MRKNVSGPTPVVNRYPSATAWRDVDDYFTTRLVAEDAALVGARESGVATSMPNAEVAPNQGAFLALLTQIAGAKRVLEFGTLAGYSTIWFARAVGTDGHVTTLELDEGNAEVARTNLERAGVASRVKVLVGSASELAQSLIDADVEPFDLVFVDADKPNNPVYLDAAMKLTRPGAVIVFDNVVRDGKVTDSASEDLRVQGVRTAIDIIAATPDLEATALQTVGVKGWDGFILARRTSSF
ncbi:MAG: O-methyltransferase [Propionibacteriaceae bacterium]|nr:O-methyltransferase [Propionibacteriaceae bacterium]